MTTRFSRRQLLGSFVAGAAGIGVSNWFPALAGQLAGHPDRRRHFVLLWMSGGPSQTDTFDLKPGHENGGEFKEIETNAPGLRFSEHLPKLATMADKLAGEILDAFHGQGATVKKRDDTHRMADANKAFAHFAW